MTYCIKIAFRVEQIDGENVYLHETVNDTEPHSRYGPMPRDFVGPLMDERKEFFEDVHKRWSSRRDA